jgi:hypothetical protein
VNDGSLAEALAAIHRAVPQALLDTDGRLRLQEVAHTLPAVLARRPVGLELRLAGDARADLIVSARPREPDGRALLAWARAAEMAELALALERWRSGFGWLAWNAEYLLLEFDAATDVRAPPCIHLAPRGAANEGPVPVSHNAFSADPAGLVGALAALAGSPPDPAAVESLERLLAGLPPFAEMFIAGSMLSRDSVLSPRVAVRRLRPEGVATILSAMDLPEVAEQLVPLAAELEGAGTRFMLDLDLGDSAPAFAGLEIHTESYWAEGRSEGWARALDVLVAWGLAERERAEAAVGLPGSRGPDEPLYGISHAKVGADAAGPRPAKLYLGIDRAHTAVSLGAEEAVGVG